MASLGSCMMVTVLRSAGVAMEVSIGLSLKLAGELTVSRVAGSSLLLFEYWTYWRNVSGCRSSLRIIYSFEKTTPPVV